MSFWKSRSGATIDGSPEKAFMPEMKPIPHGTMDVAFIKLFELIERENKHTGHFEKFYQITWKICDGEFKNREVTQRMKPFSGSNESIDRALNMLMLIMKICEFSPTHEEMLSPFDLLPMTGKMMGIKINEYSIPKDDGGLIRGNFVSEVHPLSADFKPQTGKPLEVSDSSLSRNSRVAKQPEDDIPF